MILLELPAELLHLIFAFVGSSTFRSDLSRLTVSKSWYEFAQPTCFQYFYTAPKTLARLHSSPHKASLPLLTNRMEILDLNLKGFEDWNSIRRSLKPTGITSFITNAEREYAPVWMMELNLFLYHLLTLRKQSRKLHTLRIQTNFDLDLTNNVFRGYNKYLFPSTTNALLLGSTLRSLDLDIFGTYEVPFRDKGHGEKFHICHTITTLFTTLKRLQLRTACICPLVLRPQSHGTNLPLREILINLSLSEEPTKAVGSKHTRRCCPEDEEVYLESDLYGQELYLLRADLIEEARALVTRLAAPKMVRILWHKSLSPDLSAFDVLTGRNLKLKKGAEWDDEGKPFKDAGSDLRGLKRCRKPSW